MSQISDEIKSKIDLVDFVSEYVPLKSAGANFKAPCPFHQEKTPSFLVSRPKQIWHCFGCGAGGDLFGFIMKIEGLEFPEALRLLAEKAGVVLPAYSSELSSSVRNRLLDVLKLAAKFYHKIFLDSPAGQTAREYLQKRKVSSQMIEEFQIGFIPENWDLLTKFMLKKGFGVNDLMAAGLTIAKERESGYYDRFRGRVMFPLNDVHGNVVGFTGRILDETKEKAGGKYVNTPQTAVYDKSKLLFALDKAKQEIKRNDLAVIVEGQMDVLACHQAGQLNTVASSGTALTLEQIKLLKRFTNNLALAFDADAAGQNAAERGIGIALEEGMQVKIIHLPAEAGKDPDECLKKNPETWFKAVAEAEPYMDYLFRVAFEHRDLTKAPERAAAANFILNQVAKIPDVIEQDFWLKKLANRLDVEVALLREKLAGLNKNRRTAWRPGPLPAAPSPHRELAEVASEQLLCLAFNQPALLKVAADRLKPEALASSFQEIFRDFALFYQTADLTEGKVIHSFKKWNGSERACQIIDVLELLFEQKFASLNQDELLKETLKIVESLNLWYTNAIRRQLEREMRQVEEKGDKEKITELLQKFKELI